MWMTKVMALSAFFELLYSHFAQNTPIILLLTFDPNSLMMSKSRGPSPAMIHSEIALVCFVFANKRLHKKTLS